MRHVLFSLVVLSACSPGPAGPPGPVGPAGAAADASTIAALAMRVSELEMRGAVKVPWFVDGETHEPIGRVLDYSARLVWSADLSAPLPAVPVAAFFADADCKGEARVAGAVTRYVGLADGRVVDVSPMRSPFVASSWIAPGRACAPQLDPQPDNLYSFTATGIMVNTTTPQRLSVEMR